MQTFFPLELRFATDKLFNKIFNYFSSYCYFKITEIDGVNTNELYNASQLHLISSVSITSNRLSLTCAVNSSTLTISLANNDSIVDTLRRRQHRLRARRHSEKLSYILRASVKHGFTLRIKKKDKRLILTNYLDYIMEKVEGRFAS